jgi:hypothetical protein
MRKLKPRNSHRNLSVSPKLRSRRQRAARSGSCVTIIPPSPVVIGLEGVKLKMAASPMVPV